MTNTITQVAVAGLVIVLVWLLLFWEPGGSDAESTLIAGPTGGEFTLPGQGKTSTNWEMTSFMMRWRESPSNK